VADADATLLDDVRGGDEAAFATLVSRYHPRLVRFAESLVPSRAIAEEVVHQFAGLDARGHRQATASCGAPPVSQFLMWMARGRRCARWGWCELIVARQPRAAAPPARFGVR
jgi:hypothetical protein